MHPYPSEQPHQEEPNSDESNELNSWGLTARQTDQLMDLAMRFRRHELGGPADGDPRPSQERFLRYMADQHNIVTPATLANAPERVACGGMSMDEVRDQLDSWARHGAQKISRQDALAALADPAYRQAYRKACDQLWEQHNQEIFTFLARMLANNTEASRLLQEVYSIAYDSFAFISWIFDPHENETEQQRQTQARLRLYRLAYKEFVMSAAGAAPKQAGMPFNRVLQSLDHVERACLVLHFGLGLSPAEIVEVVALDEEQVCDEVEQARQQTHQELGGPTDGDPRPSRERFLRRADQVWHEELADDTNQ